ncbi:hypothetical protein NOR_07187 [Metarhizium rileyi]|uniref:Uncharacterized protein n=1 Tax=Metarhizium rileyi (strain RCEF 4871) TaxID=1649241 RepID=A0A166YQV5_METRR|nr:hypothetical protein NOR_07187 [Metarhizium rileyi RCEF 4871]
MKFTLTSTLFLAAAVPWVSARPATTATSAEASDVIPASTGGDDTSFPLSLDFAALAEQGVSFLEDFLNEKHEAKPKRAMVVRDVAVTLRDQLNSNLTKLNSTVTEVDLDDLKSQGFQLLRERLEAQDFNKLAQQLLYSGTDRITKRDTWSWAGFLNGPMLRAASKMGIKAASSLISRVDLNAVARNSLSGLENMVGNVDANKVAEQGTGMLGSMLGKVDMNSMVRSALGFIFP